MRGGIAIEDLWAGSPLPMALVGPDERLLHANAPFAALARAAVDLVGRLVSEAAPDLWPHVAHFYKSTRESGAAATGEVRAPGAGGAEERRWRVLCHPVPLADGAAAPATCITLLDLTDADTAERRLLDRERRHNEFLAVLAHELRGPLAPIRQASELLRREPRDARRSDRALTILARQVDLLARLVGDLDEGTRIAVGALSLDFARLDLRSLVQAAIEAANPVLEGRGQPLAVALPPSPVWIEADAARVSQILANLLANASRYTPAGGRIALALVEEEKRAALRLRDEGIGIAPERLEQIFELFARTDRAAQFDGGGLGIGLAVARRLAELHGGSLRAASEGPNRGSEFTLVLPLADAQPESPAAAGARRDG